MSMRLTRWAYESLVAENIAWLKTMPRTLERDHILTILDEAVRYEYDSDYARGVEDERARHMGGTPFVSREEDFRLGVRTERARVVADLRAEANLLRTLTTNWVSHEESARKLDYAADRYERGEHKEGK